MKRTSQPFFQTDFWLVRNSHDDVTKWKHFPCYWSSVNSPHKGQWRRTLIFSLICARINDWVYNHEAGDLRRHCTHYDVTVMPWLFIDYGTLCTKTQRVCNPLGLYHNWASINTLRPRQNGRRFADDTFKGIFLNENVRISIKISLKFVPKGPINNSPALVQIVAWRRPGDKPLSEAMVDCLLTHICVTRPQWVNIIQEIERLSYWFRAGILISDYGVDK